MRFLLPLAFLTLTSCENMPDGVGDGLTIAGVIAAEGAASVRCPRSPAEMMVLTNLRAAFDIALRPTLPIDKVALVDLARTNTNLACGIVEA